ncbi:MAG TPA: DUF5915 domain-containing protein, partial [Ardenticatenaceae bacterium]
ITTEVTGELKQEGSARELARQLNQLRKDADLNLTDRIEVWVTGDVNGVLDQWADYLKAETLATALHTTVAPQDVTRRATVEVDGREVELALRK